MKLRIKTLLVLLIIAPCLHGCKSALESDDAEIRVSAVEQISNNDELFLIAMNIGLVVNRKIGGYCDASCCTKSYHDDVRVAAANRISDPLLLLKCAAWPDGVTYRHGGESELTFDYKGETCMVNNSSSTLRATVRPGGAVRTAARKRLADEVAFAKLVDALKNLNAEPVSTREKFDAKMIIEALFPCCDDYLDDNPFTESWGAIRKNNPIDRELEAIVRNQTGQAALCAFVAESIGGGMEVYPRSVERAIERIDGSDADGAEKAFTAVVENASAMQKLGYRVTVTWCWRLLDTMNRPSDSMSIAAARIGYGGSQAEGSVDKRYVNRVAERRFTANGWASCYLENLFEGYPRSRIIKNITSQEAAVRILIEAKKMQLDDIELLFSMVNDVDALKKIENDCQIESVKVKADAKLFDKTAAERFDAIKTAEDRLSRAKDALKFKQCLAESGVPKSKKSEMQASLEKWIIDGVAELEHAAAAYQPPTYSLNGFYVGMKSEDATFLFEAKYEDEEISWSVGKNGRVDRINFGMPYLIKTYRFSASAPGEWVKRLSEKINRTFVHENLVAEKKPIGGFGAGVKVSQEVWRNRDTAANITMTYFGEKKVEEFKSNSSGPLDSIFRIVSGNTTGEIISQVVLEGSRHWANNEWESGIGGFPGMLRIEENAFGHNADQRVDEAQDTLKNAYDAFTNTASKIFNSLGN